MKGIFFALTVVLASCGGGSSHSPDKPPRITKVFFGTTRGLSLDNGKLTADKTAGSGLALGRYDVALDSQYQAYSFSHMQLQTGKIMERAAYLDDTKANGDDDVVVFVHGYNNSFEDTIKTGAQLQVDEGLAGTVCVFAWPSDATTASYQADETVATSIETGKAFRQFMDMILEQSAGKRVHLVAHSLGNRVLLEGLRSYVVEKGSTKGITNAVFAAPDEQLETFRLMLETVFTKSEETKFTLYANRDDKALLLSKTIRKVLVGVEDDRAGAMNPEQQSVFGSTDFSQFGVLPNQVANNVKESFTLVDASNLSQLGLYEHAYFRDQPLISQDIASVIRRAAPASRAEHRDADCRPYYTLNEHPESAAKALSNDKRCANQ